MKRYVIITKVATLFSSRLESRAIFLVFPFKKFKGQVRRERHQATTNQEAVFAITGKAVFRERPFCSNCVQGSFSSKGQRKYWFPAKLLRKCQGEYIPLFRQKLSSN